jgi:hypothetical protein
MTCMWCRSDKGKTEHRAASQPVLRDEDTRSAHGGASRKGATTSSQRAKRAQQVLILSENFGV